jgi:MFS family permease
MTFFFLPLLLAGQGLGGLEIGVLFSIFTAMSLLSVFPIGVLNDRIGTKGLASLGLLLLSGYYFLLSGATGFWVLVPVFVLGGLAANMFSTSSLSMVLKRMWFSNEGRSIGKYNLASNVGSGLGLLLGGILLFGFDFRAVLFATAAFMFVVFLFSLPLKGTGRARVSLSSYRRLFLRKKVIIFSIPLVMFSMHWGAEQTSYSLFLKSALGLDLFWSGIYMGLPIIALGVFSYLSGRSIDRAGRSGRILVLGLVASAIGHIMMTMDPAVLSFVFRVIHEIGDALAAVSYTVIFAGMFPKKAIAGNKGLFDVVLVIGSAAGSLIFGPVGQMYGYGAPFIASGVLALAAAGLFALARR